MEDMGISPIERLLNEFEAHEMKEEKSLEQYKKLMGSCRTQSQGLFCSSSSRTRRNIVQ